MSVKALLERDPRNVDVMVKGSVDLIVHKDLPYAALMLAYNRRINTFGDPAYDEPDAPKFEQYVKTYWMGLS